MAEVDLIKSDKLEECLLTIHHSFESTWLDNIKIIERYGELVEDLYIDLGNFRGCELTENMVSGQFVDDIFRYCPNIKHLDIESCELKKLTIVKAM